MKFFRVAALLPVLFANPGFATSGDKNPDCPISSAEAVGLFESAKSAPGFFNNCPHYGGIGCPIPHGWGAKLFHKLLHNPLSKFVQGLSGYYTDRSLDEIASCVDNPKDAVKILCSRGEEYASGAFVPQYFVLLRLIRVATGSSDIRDFRAYRAERLMGNPDPAEEAYAREVFPFPKKAPSFTNPEFASFLNCTLVNERNAASTARP